MINFIYKFLRFLSILCIFIGFAILVYFACYIAYYHNNWSEISTGILMAKIFVFFYEYDLASHYIDRLAK